MEILNSYILDAPKYQNAVDIFKGEWSSRFPEHLNIVTKPGVAKLFEDDRVNWAEKIFQSFSGMNILELGPLEGGHSYMLQNKHASKIISIEANTRAYLKCLIVKEILKLDRVEFRLGDFVKFLENEIAKYDLVMASGVLYHLEEPVKLLNLISRVTDKLFIWTHYYDEEIIAKNKALKHKFGPLLTFEYEGISYEHSTQTYEDALSWNGFCGGNMPTSKWLTRSSIVKALNHYGFQDLQVNFDHPTHANGPAFAICAYK